MKEFAKIEKTLGEDGTFGASVGVEGAFIKADLSIKYPIAAIVEKAAPVTDKIIDQLEQWIPGDQKELAAKLKQEARDELVKALSEENLPA